MMRKGKTLLFPLRKKIRLNIRNLTNFIGNKVYFLAWSETYLLTIIGYINLSVPHRNAVLIRPFLYVIARTQHRNLRIINVSNKGTLGGVLNIEQGITLNKTSAALSFFKPHADLAVSPQSNRRVISKCKGLYLPYISGE